MKDTLAPVSELRFDPFFRPFFVGRNITRPHLQCLHFHPGLELLGVVSGRGFHYLDRRKTPVKPADLVAVDPMMPHETHGDGLDVVYVHLTRESIVNAHVADSGLRLLEPFAAVRSGASPVIANAAAEVDALVRAERDFRPRTPAGRQRAFNAVLSVLESVCERFESGAAGTARRSPELTLAAKAMQFMHENFTRDAGIAELARYLGISESHAAHLFKRNVGVSPIDYRNQIRITHAVEKIKSGNEKISMIALACGFNTLSQFYRSFRRVVGCSPAEFSHGDRQG
jgi:AraC-like DNA-binding protein